MSTSTEAMGAATLVGPGCADYAAANPTGAGSVEGMAAAPVATAASGNPLLTTLVAAVSGKVNPGVDLVSTLNGGEFTVFAPVDSAFAKVDAGTMTTLTTDADLLSKILTYHVISGQIAPDAIVGTHTTVEGQDLDRHRLRRRPEGQRLRRGHLRWRQDRQRDGLPDRHRPDPAGCLIR